MLLTVMFHLNSYS